MDDLDAIVRANEEKMARLRALQEADDAPVARVVSTAEAAPATIAAPAPAPAAAARPSRMGAIPARMAGVKPLAAAAAPAPAPALSRLVSPPSPQEVSRRPSFAIRGNTFNASDLFSSSDEEDAPMPPPKGYTGPTPLPLPKGRTGPAWQTSPGGRSDASGFSEESLGGSPRRGSPGRTSAGSSVDLSELRRRAEELDRQTSERAAEREREAERRAGAGREEERKREARAAAAMRRAREEEERERAREATEMISAARSSEPSPQLSREHAAGHFGSPSTGGSRLQVQTPSSNSVSTSPTRAAPRLTPPSAAAAGSSGGGSVSAGTQTDSGAAAGRAPLNHSFAGQGPGAPGPFSGGWGGGWPQQGPWGGMGCAGYPPIFVLPFPCAGLLGGGPHAYGGYAGDAPWAAPYGPPPPYHSSGSYHSSYGGGGPGFPAGVPAPTLVGPHIPMARVIGILPPAGAAHTATAPAVS